MTTPSPPWVWRRGPSGKPSSQDPFPYQEPSEQCPHWAARGAERAAAGREPHCIYSRGRVRERDGPRAPPPGWELAHG